MSRRPEHGLTENLKKNIRNSENDARRRNQRYYFPKLKKINTSVEMNADSARRIQDLHKDGYTYIQRLAKRSPYRDKELHIPT